MKKTINSLIEIKDGFTKGSSKWDKIDVVLREVISIIGENETLQRAYNEKKKKLELYEWAFKGIDQAYQKQVEENIGVSSGKCGFTTLREIKLVFSMVYRLLYKFYFLSNLSKIESLNYFQDKSYGTV